MAGKYKGNGGENYPQPFTEGVIEDEPIGETAELFIKDRLMERDGVKEKGNGKEGGIYPKA